MNRFEPGQIVRVIRPSDRAYGRLAVVVMAASHQVKMQFIDLPKRVQVAQNLIGALALVESSALAPVDDVPKARIYLHVTVVERDGDRRYVHHCLAHSCGNQTHQQVADGVTKGWYGIGGKWDTDEQVYRFSCRRFVLAEDWRELSLAEYINLRDFLSDRTGEAFV